MSKEYIIERITIGNSTKVTAIDPDTGIEACVVTPSSLNESDQATLAIKKLEYVIRKRGIK